jgi:hypothetical protein
LLRVGFLGNQLTYEKSALTRVFDDVTPDVVVGLSPDLNHQASSGRSTAHTSLPNSSSDYIKETLGRSLSAF